MSESTPEAKKAAHELAVETWLWREDDHAILELELALDRFVAARLGRERARYHAALEEGMLMEKAGRLAEGVEGHFDRAVQELRLGKQP